MSLRLGLGLHLGSGVTLVSSPYPTEALQWAYLAANEATWSDSSGGGNTLTTATTAPTFVSSGSSASGKDVRVFNAATPTGLRGASATPFTFLHDGSARLHFGFRPTSSNDFQALFCDLTSGALPSIEVFYRGGIQQISCYIRTASGTILTMTGAAAINTNHVVTIRMNSALAGNPTYQAIMRVNGSQVGQVDFVGTPSASAGPQALRVGEIARPVPTGLNHFTGEMWGILGYDSGSDADTAAVEAYLA